MAPRSCAGFKSYALHEYQTEHAAMVKWDPNTRFNAHKHWGGEEIYVVDGVFYDQFGAYPKDLDKKSSFK